MNKNGCIHPEILAMLSRCGHGDRVLIADGNYPIESRCPDAKRVYLGVCAGLPTVTDVMEALLSEIAVESAAVMTPGTGEEPAIFQEFRELLGGMVLTELGRYPFYEEAAKPDVRLVISTGEKRTFANILLTVGVA